MNISGGNLFNQRLIAALGKELPLECMDVGEWRQTQATPSVCIVDTLNLEEFTEVYAKRIAGQRFVLLVHHLLNLEPGVDRNSPEACREREILTFFDGFIVTSAYAGEVLRSYGLKQGIVTLLPCVDHVLMTLVPWQTKVNAVMACNLLPRKGVLEFLECLSEEVQVSDCFTLEIVGRSDIDPSYALLCKDIVECEKIADRVRFKGAVAYEGMPAVYQRANLFVSASKMETFGIALQEARYFGLPIVSVRGGNSANHVEEGRTGLCVSDPTELAKTFLALVRKPERLHGYWQQAARTDRGAMHSWQNLAVLLKKSLHDWFAGSDGR